MSETLYHNDGTPIPEKGQPGLLNKALDIVNPWARLNVVTEIAENRGYQIDGYLKELKVQRDIIQALESENQLVRLELMSEREQVTALQDMKNNALAKVAIFQDAMSRSARGFAEALTKADAAELNTYEETWADDRY